MSTGTKLRLLVTGVLMALVFWMAEETAVLAEASQASPRWIATAVALVVVDRALMAGRWVMLLRTSEAGRAAPLADIVRVFFLSTFVGTFLPTSIGADALRAYGLTRSRVTGAVSVASVAMDRLLGSVSLLLMAVLGLALSPDLLHETVVVSVMVAMIVACGTGAAVVYSDQVASWMSHFLALSPWERVTRLGTSLIDSVRTYAAQPSTVGQVFGLSVGVQVIRVLQAYALGQALGATAPLHLYFAFVPFIMIVIMMPISLYGLGTSQLAFVWLFGSTGMPEAEALALSVLFLCLGVFGNLPGGLLFAMGRRARHAPS